MRWHIRHHFLFKQATARKTKIVSVWRQKHPKISCIFHLSPDKLPQRHESCLPPRKITTIYSILGLFSHICMILCDIYLYLILISWLDLWPVTEENANMTQMFSATSVGGSLHPNRIIYIYILIILLNSLTLNGAFKHIFSLLCRL